MDHPYWFHSPPVLWCLGVSRGHLVLTCWPSRSSAVIHKRIRRCSYDHRRRSPPPPSLPPSSSPSRSHCLNVIWQTKRPFIQSRNKTQHPPFTLRPSNSPTNAATFSKTRLSAFFYFISEGRELLTPDQRGYHSKHGRDPNCVHVCVCLCVRECDLCVKAMKKPIVVMQVCLISVYTTMSVVLWSPLVRLLAGLCCDPGGNAEGNAEICACPLDDSVIRDTHQRSRLSGHSLVFASPASSASRLPLDLRWRGPAAPGSGGAAAQCASQGPGERSSAWVFTFCSLLT